MTVLSTAALRSFDIANLIGFPNPHQAQPVAPSTARAWDVVRPSGKDYAGAERDSDLVTLANVPPQQAYPGSAYPNQAIERAVAPGERGLPNAAPTPGRGGRLPVR